MAAQKAALGTRKKKPSEVVRGIPSVLGIDRPGDSGPAVTQVKDE